MEISLIPINVNVSNKRVTSTTYFPELFLCLLLLRRKKKPAQNNLYAKGAYLRMANSSPLQLLLLHLYAPNVD